MTTRKFIKKISFNIATISNVLLGSIILTNKEFLEPPVICLMATSAISTAVLIKTRKK